MVFFTTPELLEIGGLPMTSLNEKPGRTEALKYYRRVAEYYGLNIHQYERVLSITGADGDFHVKTSKTEYRARKIVLATGYYDVPNMLNVPGEELDKVIHYYKEPHPYYNHDVSSSARRIPRLSRRSNCSGPARASRCCIAAPRFPIASNTGSSPTSKTASRAVKSRPTSIRS